MILGGFGEVRAPDPLVANLQPDFAVVRMIRIKRSIHTGLLALASHGAIVAKHTIQAIVWGATQITAQNFRVRRVRPDHPQTLPHG